MIHHGDLFDVLPTLSEASVDACVTDPPYGIGFMGREWDTFKPGSGKHRKLMHPREREAAKIVSDNPNIDGRHRSPALSPSQIDYDRSLEGQRGFQEWTAAWSSEVLRVLKPGAYIVVCGAPRSHHRMMCGLEDAGFVVRDCFAWLFGSGFPKNKNLGNGRGTALKPAHEPIALAWKPFKGTISGNVETHGTGALNIDACRLATADVLSQGSAKPGANFSDDVYEWGNRDTEQHPLGRWPANVLLDEDAAAMLDEMTGDVGGGIPTLGARGVGVADGYMVQGGGGYATLGKSLVGHEDRGGASRFYYVAKPSNAEREYGLDGIEIVTVEWSSWEGADQKATLRVDTGQFPPKVTVASGTPHSDVSVWNTFLFGNGTTAPSLTRTKSITATVTSSITGSRTLHSLARLLTSADIAVVNGASRSGGNLVGSAAPSTPSLTITSGLTGSPLGVGPVPSAARLQINGNAGRPASHPTVKPVELMRWLVKLVTPIGGTVLDPFLGSGTTGMACRYEQRQFIGIEREAEYVAIAERRIAAVAPLFAEEAV